MRKRIGECLIQAGLITEDDLRTALEEHKRTGERIGVVLVKKNLAAEQQVAKALALQLGFPYISLDESPPDPAAVTLIPKDVALERVCIAVRLEKNLLTVAMSDPLLFSLVQELEWQTGYRIEQVVATRSAIADAIERGYPATALIRATPANSRQRDGLHRSESASVDDFVDLVVKGAIKSHASDIHIEPTEKGVLIRHRLDGLLKEVMNLPMSVHEGLVARLKIMAGMDVAEKRLPQDGRLRSTSEDGTDVDFRVSTLRTLFGEKVVMRVLDHRKNVPALDEIGMSASALEAVRQFLRHPHGMILVAGPTGSGKTTTLSSSLQSMQSERTNIITIEDPIEYQIPGVNQTQINETIGLAFASALRSILNQDPDVIMVGEIRDAETATIAMQAAQSGRLVLSALQTDDAPSVVTRLTAMGAEPFVVAAALIGVVAQRLVRRLCVHCRRQYTPPAEVLRALNIPELESAAIRFYTSVGCDQCNHTGYRGRVGIYEVMRVTDNVRQRISTNAPEDQVREAAIAAGMVTLGEDGLAKIKSGITTAEELLRVVGDAREMRTLCTQCGGAVGVDFNACPRCGQRLGGGCPHCRRALRPGWHFCPYCARSIEPERAARRLRDRPGRDARRELPSGKVAEFKK